MKKIIAFIFTAQFFCAIGFAQKQGQERVDSILSVVNSWSSLNNLHDTLLAASYIELAYELHKIDPDKGILFGQKALELSTKINWKKGVASAYNRIGLCYWAKSDLPVALEYQFKSLKLNEEIDFKIGIATVLGNIGLVYNDQRDFTKALDYHFRALKINEELKNVSGEARNLGNIGIVYDATGEYEKALQYYSKALMLYLQLNDKVGIARNLGNMAFVYQEMGLYAQALEYNARALQMNSELGNTIQIGINLGNMGEEYYHIAADTTKSRTNILPDSLRNKRSALIKAEEYLTKSITIFTEVNDQNFLQELYQYLSDVQLLKGNYSAGLTYYKKSIAYRDSVYNEDNKRKIAQLEKTREEDLKQKEIELLKSQNEIQRLTAQRRMAITYGLGCAFIGLSFLTFAFFNQNKKKEKINRELQQAYTDLKLTQAELVKQEKLASLGKLTSNIAHEIQNPLNFVNNFSEVTMGLADELVTSQSEQEKKEILNDLKEMLGKINSHGKRADGIVKKMQKHLRDGTGHELFDN